ncbi:hypothetical protein ACIQW9_04870 [Herminiimonas sp. NPDC097707]
MKKHDLSAAKRAAAVQLVENGVRLKKWLCACIAIGMTLLTLAIAID